MSITIEQIAEQAGVSPSTVARVLRGDFKGAQQRSIDKALEIQRISQELGYRPNWRARALSKGQTRTIGLLFTNPMWIFESPMNEIAVGFTEALQAQRYDLRLIPVDDEAHWEELVYGGAVDGVVAMVSTPSVIRNVLSHGRVPVVVVGDRFPGASHVVADDENGAYLATRHLLGLGHERIVFYVSDTIREHYSVGARRAGYDRAMGEASGATTAETWHINDVELTQRLLSPSRPTAILCYCHVEALRITHAAWVHGLSIPADLSLVAFNDMSMTPFMSPPLTVVGFDTVEMGRVGAEMLIRRIRDNGPSKPESVVLRQRLIVRNTTARPLGR